MDDVAAFQFAVDVGLHRRFGKSPDGCNQQGAVGDSEEALDDNVRAEFGDQLAKEIRIRLEGEQREGIFLVLGTED